MSNKSKSQKYRDYKNRTPEQWLEIVADLQSKNTSLGRKLKEEQSMKKILFKRIDSLADIQASIRDSIQLLPPIDSQYKPEPTAKTEEVMNLVVSDLHMGEVIKRDVMNGINEYNFEIACDRLWFLQQEVVKIVEERRTSKTVQTLYIHLLGDIVNGVIHELETTNEYNVIETLVQTAHVLAQFIRNLSSCFKNIVITTIVGNHGRLQQRKDYKQPQNSFDWLVYQMIKDKLADIDNVAIKISNSQWEVVRIFKYDILLEHGDLIAGYSLPSIAKHRNGRKDQLEFANLRFDYMIIGHYHSPREDQNVLVNGSLVGANEYSANYLKGVAPPSQKIFFINEKYGINSITNLRLNKCRGHLYEYKFVK